VQGSRGRTPGAGRLGQDTRNRTTEEDNRDNAVRIGNRGQDDNNMTARTGPLRKDDQDGITVAGQ
jgi:hypothetical protein